eukprot:TRINITY_DN7179_c0_g2_i1.p1 TRINITY_DN7179_c0_g2~~TRINITY_DN7179_c0_g2_i1.p1  ORF type:complete len:304 (-),score=42.51 TRINITY_DN7179_c0_g2_i1:90-1001(-)
MYESGMDGPKNAMTRLKRNWTPIQILAEVLKKKPWVTSINAIETAKVPVLKVTAKVKQATVLIDITFSVECGKKMSVSYNSDNSDEDAFAGNRMRAIFSDHSGLAASKLVREYVKTLPALTPLALVLKQFLYERDLNDTYTGGISSYCLVLMIVAFLKINVAPLANGKEKERVNLGTILLEFLRFFGEQFDFDKMGISLHNGGEYFYVPQPGSTLVIIDPFHPKRNIGHSVFGMWRVKAAFKHAFSTLLSPYTTKFAPTLLSRIIHPHSPTPSSANVVQPDAPILLSPPWASTHAAYFKERNT